MNIVAIEPDRLAKAKIACTTRYVDINAITTLITGDIKPESGDLVLARVDKTGQHERLELSNGRKANLFPGDEIVLCYGNRYAPDQFEAVIPADLSPCSMAAAGGIAAQVLSKHAKMKMPTAITPIGLIGDKQGKRINIADWALPATTYIGQRPCTVAVVGTSMNSGKSTTAANFIKGLVNAGLKVGAAKITGTGAGNDIWLMRDAGACLVLDFTSVGFPSTYRATLQQVQGILHTLTNHLAAEGVDAIVLEIADGLYQEETSALVSSLEFRETVDAVLFTAGTALGAAAGVEWLQRHELPILAVSGLVNTSPLAVREAERATKFPIFSIQMLHEQAADLLQRAKLDKSIRPSARNFDDLVLTQQVSTT